MSVEVQTLKSVGFKDISMSFQDNPLTNDLIALKNEKAIVQAVKNLVLTDPGERLYRPDLGTGLSSSLFDLIDVISAAQIADYIESTIKNYEPRVILTNVNVTPDFEINGFYTTIVYTIVGIEPTPRELSFPLVKTR
jgi:phage baseplate assembly protein W